MDAEHITLNGFHCISCANPVQTCLNPFVWTCWRYCASVKVSGVFCHASSVSRFPCDVVGTAVVQQTNACRNKWKTAYIHQVFCIRLFKQLSVIYIPYYIHNTSYNMPFVDICWPISFRSMGKRISGEQALWLGPCPRSARSGSWSSSTWCCAVTHNHCMSSPSPSPSSSSSSSLII